MTVTLRSRRPVELRCHTCRGVISRDGEPIHDHHPSCSYWSLRCRICELPIVGAKARARHPDHAELCFKCGDALEVDSHP